MKQLSTDIVQYTPDRVTETTEGIKKWIDESSKNWDDDTWLMDLTEFTQVISSGAETLFQVTGSTLAQMRNKWKNKELSPAIRAEYPTFHDWGRTAAPGKANSTIDNYIAVVEHYFTKRNQEGGFALPPTLYVSRANGDTMAEVVPDINKATFAKLLSAKSLSLSKGNLEEGTIAALCDEKVSSEDFKDYLRIERGGFPSLDSIVDDAPKPKLTGIKPEAYVSSINGHHYEEGGNIFYSKGGIDTAILSAAGVDFLHPLALEGLNAVYARFGFPLLDVAPAHVNPKLDSPKVFEAEVEEGEPPVIVLNLDGYMQYSYSVTQAKELVSQLQEVLDGIEKT